MTGHLYLSTACTHAIIASRTRGNEEVEAALHARCRQACKFCEAPCFCVCHQPNTDRR